MSSSRPRDDEDRAIFAFDLESLLDTLVVLYESGAVRVANDWLEGINRRDWTVLWQRRHGSGIPEFRARGL